MNIVTCTVFWSSLYYDTIVDCHGNGWYEANVYLAHILPGFSALICFLITDVTIRSTHSIAILVIGIWYGYINYTETKKKGTPIYWFLTWEDETSFYIYGGLVLFAAIVWLSLSALSLAMKPRPLKKRDQENGRSTSPTKRSKLE